MAHKKTRGFERIRSQLYSLKALTTPQKSEFPHIGNDPVDLLSAIDAQMQGSLAQVSEVLDEGAVSYSQAFLKLKELSGNPEARLPAKDKLAIQKKFNLPEDYAYPERDLLITIKQIVLEDLQVSAKRNYTLHELMEFAQFADQFYELNMDLPVFSGFSEQEILNIYEHEGQSFFKESVFEFAIMTPAQRRGYLATRLEAKAGQVAKIKFLLGIKEEDIFSIADIKAYADKFDKKGSEASGLIPLGTLTAPDRDVFYRKKYSFKALIRYLLMDTDSRYSWIQLQT